MSAWWAVIRRDLRGASRSATPALGRFVALAGCGAAAVAAFARVDGGLRDDLSAWFAACIFGLMALGLPVALTQAVGAFRSERTGGTLDLLLLAGLRPGTLVTARAASTWLLLLSIVGAALPALLLFGFFRTPSPSAALAHAVALACFLAVLSAWSIAVSAWSSRPGTALAAGVLLLGGFAALSAHPAAAGTWSAVGLSAELMDASRSLPGERLGLAVLGHGVLVVVGLVAATAGLERRPRSLGVEPRASAGSPSPRCDGRHPMTWLLARTSAAARPHWQLLGAVLALLPLAVGSVAGAWGGGGLAQAAEPGLLSAFGGAAALIAIAAALAAGATQVASHRERSAWDEVATSARDAERLFTDLLRATLGASFIPLLTAATLLTAAELRRGAGLLDAAHCVAAVTASLFFAAVLGLAASACSDRSATAVAMATLLLAGLPLIVALLHEAGAAGLVQGAVQTLVLFAVLAAIFLPYAVRGLGPFFLLLVESAAEWKRGGRPGPARFLLRPAIVLVPLAVAAGIAAGPTSDGWALAFGGLHASAFHLFTLGEAREALGDDALLGGALWQALFAFLVLAGTWRHRDLWLGRAAR